MPDAGEGITFIRGMPEKRSNSWLSMYDRSVDVLNRVTESITIPKYDFLRLIVRFWKSRGEQLNLLNLFIGNKSSSNFRFSDHTLSFSKYLQKDLQIHELISSISFKKKTKKKLGKKTFVHSIQKNGILKFVPVYARFGFRLIGSRLFVATRK